MFAIIKDGARQFTVKKGDVIDIDLREGAEKSKGIEFTQVVYVNTGKDVKVGAPLVAGASVTGKVLAGVVKGPRVISFKFRRRKNSRTKRGHRQQYTRVQVTDIKA